MLTALTLLCLVPMINAVAISFSQKAYVTAGQVTLWPKGFTLYSYRYLLQRAAFWQAFRVSVIRLILGTLVKIYIPCSMAAIATISLFCMVNHWNSWFDGLIYITSINLKPLQTYLRMIVVELDMSKISLADIEELKVLSDKGLRAVQVIVSIIPILAVYPFLQKYFVKGIVLGSVKG
jgi:ABC-type glycerol-3-phosphate transport system permease component